MGGYQKEAGFELFWEIYDKKVGKKKTFQKWMRLSVAEHKQIIDQVPLYVRHTPDKKYRKNPLTYLNGEHWEDEIIDQSNCNNQDVKTKLEKYS